MDGGNVVLYGTVALYIQKMLYEQIAWKTVGVVEVENEIRVAPKLPQTDPAIERKILDLLHTHDRLKHTGLKVEVENGSVSINIMPGRSLEVRCWLDCCLVLCVFASVVAKCAS